MTWTHAGLLVFQNLLRDEKQHSETLCRVCWARHRNSKKTFCVLCRRAHTGRYRQDNVFKFSGFPLYYNLCLLYYSWRCDDHALRCEGVFRLLIKVAKEEIAEKNLSLTYFNKPSLYTSFEQDILMNIQTPQMFLRMEHETSLFDANAFNRHKTFLCNVF